MKIFVVKKLSVEALEKKRDGVNVLIYGTPGSGKTEFVKMLAQEINHPLFEIATEDSSGDPIRRANRFRSFRLSQHILDSNESQPLVLFDEVEDVFQIGEDEDEPKGGNASGMKGWINKLLESNQIPSFWLSNNFAVWTMHLSGDLIMSSSLMHRHVVCEAEFSINIWMALKSALHGNPAWQSTSI